MATIATADTDARKTPSRKVLDTGLIRFSYAFDKSVDGSAQGVNALAHSATLR
jgi:hypothetical protein